MPKPAVDLSDAARRFAIIVNKLERELICTICESLLTDCRRATCGHWFCHSCVEDLIKNKPPGQRSAPCPECNHPIVRRSLKEDDMVQAAIEAVFEMKGIVEQAGLEKAGKIADSSATESPSSSSSASTSSNGLPATPDLSAGTLALLAHDPPAATATTSVSQVVADQRNDLVTPAPSMYSPCASDQEDDDDDHSKSRISHASIDASRAKLFLEDDDDEGEDSDVFSLDNCSFPAVNPEEEEDPVAADKAFANKLEEILRSGSPAANEKGKDAMESFSPVKSLRTESPGDEDPDGAVNRGTQTETCRHRTSTCLNEEDGLREFMEQVIRPVLIETISEVISGQ